MLPFLLQQHPMSRRTPIFRVLLFLRRKPRLQLLTKLKPHRPVQLLILHLCLLQQLQCRPQLPNVNIQNFAFSPSPITIKKGDKIVWTNKDSAPHTVRIKWSFDDSLDSGPINQGQTFSYTFTNTGSFTYSCSFHPSMHGAVTVTE